MRVLLRELRELGYDGNNTILSKCVRPRRRERQPAATMRFETGPGEHARVDLEGPALHRRRRGPASGLGVGMNHIFHNLLRLDALTFSDGVSAAFFLGYRLEDRSGDLWSDRFTKFKFEPDDVSSAGAARLMVHAARILVYGLGLSVSRTVFAPALRSAERSADPNGVPAMIAQRCAEVAGCRYEPGLLQKNVNLPTGRGALDPAFRVLLAENADYRSASTDADTVIIVDDFVATGKTLSLAARAILERNPCTTVYGLALAKPEWHGLMLDWYDTIANNDHIPHQWNDIWLSGSS